MVAGREMVPMPFVAYGILDYLRMASVEGAGGSPVETAFRSRSAKYSRSAGRWRSVGVWGCGNGRRGAFTPVRLSCRPRARCETVWIAGGTSMVVDQKGIVVLIPVFNDWEAVALLLGQLDQALEDVEAPVSVLLVDDGSTDVIPQNLHCLQFRHVHSIEVLSLRRNLGHQCACGRPLPRARQAPLPGSRGHGRRR